MRVQHDELRIGCARRLNCLPRCSRLPELLERAHFESHAAARRVIEDEHLEAAALALTFPARRRGRGDADSQLAGAELIPQGGAPNPGQPESEPYLAPGGAAGAGGARPRTRSSLIDEHCDQMLTAEGGGHEALRAVVTS